MERQDKGLAFIQRYENIAWYEEGCVRILDRRVYPAKTEFVLCHTHEEVMLAIRNMVTQSAGPYTAAPMGLALAAWECKGKSKELQMEYLKKAAATIASARPTTRVRMEVLLKGCFPTIAKALEEGKPVDEAIRDHVEEANNRRYSKIARMGEELAEIFPENGTVMTQCYADTILGTMLRACRERNKHIRLFVPETRPYLQGARLTATVCAELGFDTTLITDNMPAYVMAREKVDVFTCAADAITCDGYVFNKVGTSQIAISAKYFGVPVYVSGAPDEGHPTHDTVTIEMRNPNETLEAMGVRTAAVGLGIKGYYPAFDMTPPELITGIVTEKGVFKPTELASYFEKGGVGEYR
ncbi:MAG: s-methyl-5-thioribose-1-phosphate isomerase [Spirochaetales bacterium]|nr:s-methyl-5-thioribose-1-phosphate isomerase [Candidatus Physcosoma equi]